MASSISYLPNPENLDQAHTARLLVLSVSANYVVSGSSDGSIRVWDKHRRLLALPPLQGSLVAAFTSLAISEKLGVVIGGNSHGEVILWRLADGERIAIHSSHTDAVLGLVVDDTVIVSVSRDGCSKIWEIGENGGVLRLQLKHTLREHGTPVLAAFILDNRIFTSSGDHRVQVWDRMSGECVKSMGVVASMRQVKVEVVGTETWLVGACSDGAIRVYNMDEETEIACLQGHQGVVSAVSIMATDAAETESEALRVVSASYDGLIGIWSVQRKRLYSWQVVRWISFSESVVHPFPSSRKVRTPASSKQEGEFVTLPFDVQVDSGLIYCCGESACMVVVECGQ